MKKNKLVIGLVGLVAGLVTTGCNEEYDDDAALNNDYYMSLPVGRSYEAQWMTDREVIDTATLSISGRNSIRVSRVPADWLLAYFSPDVTRNGIFQSSQPLMLACQMVGYSGTNSYFSTSSAMGSNAENTPYVVALTSDRQLFSVESNAADDRLTATAYWSPAESAGVYDGQHDAWTVTFAVDSVVVERIGTDEEHAADGETAGSDATRSYRTVQRFSPAVRLNLVTTKRKE